MAKPANDQREQLFCHLYSALGNAREAALRAGYPPTQADSAAATLLERPDIREKLRECANRDGGSPSALALQALVRTALSPCNDAVRLAFLEEGNLTDLDRLDLYMVSEVKYAKGGWEIKFRDRMEAIKLLLEHAGGDNSFLEALRNSIRPQADEDDNGD